MIRVLTPVAFVVVTACAVPPGGMVDPLPDPDLPPITDPTPVEPPQQTAKARFVQAVENNGCVMTPGNVNTILDQAVIGQDELRSIVPALQADGVVETSGDSSIRVLTSQCI